MEKELRHVTDPKASLQVPPDPGQSISVRHPLRMHGVELTKYRAADKHSAVCESTE